MSEPTSPARVAVIQLDPQVGMANRANNLLQSIAMATEAVNGGANLIVLPELSACGYFFSSRQDAFDHAESIPNGASFRAWIDFACTHQVYLVAGLNEIEGMQLFNTAVLLGPDGLSASTVKLIYGTWKSFGSHLAILVFPCLKHRSVVLAC